MLNLEMIRCRSVTARYSKHIQLLIIHSISPFDTVDDAPISPFFRLMFMFVVLISVSPVFSLCSWLHLVILAPLMIFMFMALIPPLDKINDASISSIISRWWYIHVFNFLYIRAIIVLRFPQFFSTDVVSVHSFNFSFQWHWWCWRSWFWFLLLASCSRLQFHKFSALTFFSPPMAPISPFAGIEELLHLLTIMFMASISSLKQHIGPYVHVGNLKSHIINCFERWLTDPHVLFLCTIGCNWFLFIHHCCTLNKNKLPYLFTSCFNLEMSQQSWSGQASIPLSKISLWLNKQPFCKHVSVVVILNKLQAQIIPALPRRAGNHISALFLSLADVLASSSSH